MNRYAKLTPEQLEEHFSNYLIDSWSYSAVTAFARNEKAFEMQYVYREKDRRSISSIAGNAYHDALRVYFEAMGGFGDNEPHEESLVNLTQVAYDYLDTVEPSSWKLTDKIDTVEAAVAEATSTVNKLLKNFAAEAAIYSDEIAQVYCVENKMDAWVTVNGVDIPLPLHAVLDLVVRTKDGKTVIIDHKSKSKFTPEDEVVLVHGQQAITYVKAWEAQEVLPGMETTIDEVWFIENKSSANKDGSPQLVKHIIKMDSDSRRLYEALLYEPLRRMLEAVSDPDYIYTINKDDNFVDKALLYDFWARTQISEIEDFPDIPEDKKGLISARQRKIKDSSIGNINPKIITEFRKAASRFIAFDYAHSNMTPQEKIEHILRTHKLTVKVADVVKGFSCDTYLLDLGAGTSVTSVFAHIMDIAYALDVTKVRINNTLVVYNGKSYVGVEVTKERTENLLWDKKYLQGHRLPLGLDNFRNPVVWDLDGAAPHLLVCGGTKSGKSVCLTDILYYAIEAGVKDITVLDPKYEFAYAELPENVRVLSDIPDIEAALKDMVKDMNTRVKERKSHLSLVIFDEFADAVEQARKGKELDIVERVEAGVFANGTTKYENKVVGREKSLIENFKMLLQKGRSAGFRFVAATQRASVQTIPGDIKVNMLAQVCFRVGKGLDSKVVIDAEGAECLAGYGDGLIHSPEYNDGLVRFQAFYRPL